MRSRYKITEEIKAEIKEYLRKEKSVVVKERLIAVNMYINGMIQSEVAQSLGRNRGFVGVAVKNYFRGGKEGLEEQRGGDRRNELTEEEREKLGFIIENSYPIQAKG